MSNKSREEKSEEIERLKPNKEELAKSILQTIKEFEEGRIILSSQPKEFKIED